MFAIALSFFLFNLFLSEKPIRPWADIVQRKTFNLMVGVSLLFCRFILGVIRI
jgi:hypothetical protein